MEQLSGPAQELWWSNCPGGATFRAGLGAPEPAQELRWSKFPGRLRCGQDAKVRPVSQNPDLKPTFGQPEQLKFPGPCGCDPRLWQQHAAVRELPREAFFVTQQLQKTVNSCKQLPKSAAGVLWATRPGSASMAEPPRNVVFNSF